MEKPDTSDLYKFFSTLGLLLVSSAFIVIWILSNENDVFLISREVLEGLPDLAKDTIEVKQKFLAYIYSIKNIIVLELLFLGVVSFSYGIFKWRSRQQTRDKIEDKQLMEELPEDDEAQKSKRAQEEVNETEGNDPDDVDTSKINTYRGIEEKVSSAINKKYGKNYLVRNNVRLVNSEFDIVMYSERTKNFKVIEIKYYNKNVGYAVLENGYMRFALSHTKFERHFDFNESDNRSVQYILVWVYNDNEKTPELQKYKKRLSDKFRDKKIDIKIIEENKIDDLSL